MNRTLFNEFCRDFKEVIGSYLNDEAWEVSERWFSDGKGEIIIEYDLDEVDWDEVDCDWESSCDDDLCELCKEWGGSWDWYNNTISWGFNL